MIFFASNGMALDPTPGWFSVILQGGSFAVLVYLMIYGLPKLLRELAAERLTEQQGFGTLLKEQRQNNLESEGKQRVEFLTDERE